MGAARYHPALGFDRMISASPMICSSCCDEIPEDHVPLILFSWGREAWQYCERCEGPILARLLAQTPSAAPPPMSAEARPAGDLRVIGGASSVQRST